MLFLILINDIGFPGQLNDAGVLLSNHRRLNIEKVIHLKFVDDLTLCEAIDLQTKLTGKTLDGSADSAPYVLSIQQTEMNNEPTTEVKPINAHSFTVIAFMQERQFSTYCHAYFHHITII